MTKRADIILATIVIIILVILIILAIVLKGVYSPLGTDYGTWGPFRQTICINDGQACTVNGVSQKIRECTPNPVTGKGCIDSSGNQTYKAEIVNISCTPICYSSVWQQNTIQPCQNYTDANATTLASNQTCVTSQTGEFSFQKIVRTCIAQDSTGINSCVKSDGNLANVGESEEILFPCTTIPQCYPGEWQQCGNSCTTNADCIAPQLCDSGFCQPRSTKIDVCGSAAADCGRLLILNDTPKCLVDGQSVATSNCYPPDMPTTCETGCLNFPCSTFPIGFSNVSGFQNFYLEIFDTGSLDYILADFNNTYDLLTPNPIAATNGSNVLTVTSIAHGFQNNQVVGISGSTNVHGVPSSEINVYHFISNVTSNTFDVTVTTNATSSGSGGGALVNTIIGQKADAISQTKDVFLINNVATLTPNPIATTNGSSIITITMLAHGFTNGMIIAISGATTVGGITALVLNNTYAIQNATLNTFDINVVQQATSTTNGGGSSVKIHWTIDGPVNTIFGNIQLDRMRFVIDPSQAELPNGAFYMLGFIPYNGQSGICSWDGAKIVLNRAPALGPNQTYDDVPGLTKFAFTGASAPYTLNVYTAGPTYTPIYCGASCIDANSCDRPYDDGTGTCI